VTQPDYVPLQATDRVRPSALLPPPRQWYLDRPAEQTDLEQPRGPRFGATGPDLGYGLKLARRMEPRLQLAKDEHMEDVIAGGFASGSKRSAHFGRAPVIYDMEWAFGLWGFLGGAPDDLIDWRRELFKGAAEQYWDQREIVDAIRPEALSLLPLEVRERLPSWRELFIV
jgi:hypothetical protein